MSASVEINLSIQLYELPHALFWFQGGLLDS
jgi:hypothetical protein